MKIRLKRDWEIPIQPPFVEKKIIGHFAGRKQEIEFLTNEILCVEQGSILVSGYRGVGKTSTVYKALSEVKKREENLLIVLLNVTQLDVKNGSEDANEVLPERIIQNLIRRLYSRAKNSDSIRKNEKLREKIEILYKKAIAKEFSLSENYQNRLDFLLDMEREESKEILLSEKNISSSIFMVSWLFAVIFQFFPLCKSEGFNKLLPLLLAFPLPFSINLVRKRKKKEVIKQAFEAKAETLYKFDNNIGNLEFDLEEVHKDLYDSGIKLIYVIDELDKLNSGQALNVLEFFKNLFTLSKAIFIFIGGEEIYQKLKPTQESSQNQDKIYRPKEYTYFTSKYFLARPMWKDLSEYIDEIVGEKDIDNGNFEILKRLLLFEAKNDFFDLIAAIKDKINRFDDNGCGIIEIEKYNNEDILKYKMHKLITTLFEEKYFTSLLSKWYENEDILRNLFKHASFLFSLPGYVFEDTREDSISASAIRYFNRLLYRLKGLDIVEDKQMQMIRGLEVPIRKYKYTGDVSQEPPTKLSELSEIEERFVNEFKRYYMYIISLNNVFLTKGSNVSIEKFLNDPKTYVQKINNWGFDTENQFNTYYPIFNKLISEPSSSTYRREEIEKQTEQISIHINNMLASLNIIFANIIQSLYPKLNFQTQKLSRDGNLFSGPADQIKKALQSYDHNVVFKPDYSRQILLLADKLDIIKNLKQNIKDNSETCVVVSIEQSPEKLVTKGFSQIDYETPKTLLSSTRRFLNYLSKFLRV